MKTCKKFKVGDKVKLKHYPRLKGVIVCAYLDKKKLDNEESIRYGVRFNDQFIKDVGENEVVGV